MTGSSPCANPVSQYIDCELSMRTSRSENMKETVNIRFEALDLSLISEKNKVLVPNVELAAGGSLHVPNSISDQDDMFMCNETYVCQEFSQSLSLDAKVQKCLSKSATFPSKERPPNSSSSEGGADSLGKAVQGQYSSASVTSAYARSVSLPTSLSLVSAMKGGRAQNGTLPKVELRVKWSPEVHDPPANSMSHTVKVHNQRPKSKKKDKHKNKGKSRGSGSERKHANRKNISKISDPVNARLQTSGERLVLDGYGNSKVEILESGINGQEVKCGSSFLREALPKLHLSIGEASWLDPNGTICRMLQ